MGLEACPKDERLRRRSEFRAVFEGGRRVERSSVVLIWTRGEGSGKAGFTVSRQVRGSVARNRARRRLREAYRFSRGLLPPSVHVVLVARGSALENAFSDLRRDVRDGLQAIAERCRASGA